jgi:hypothetical protein
MAVEMRKQAGYATRMEVLTMALRLHGAGVVRPDGRS